MFVFPALSLRLLSSASVHSRRSGRLSVSEPRRSELQQHRQEPVPLQHPGAPGHAGPRGPAAPQQPEPELQRRGRTTQRAQHHPHRWVSAGVIMASLLTR